MRFKFAILALVAALGFATAVQATPIVQFNARPVPVNAPPGSELSLQTILDVVVPGTNALTGQNATAMWVPAPGSVASTPQLRFEQAGNAATNVFGLWFGSDDTNLFLVDMFLGPAGPGTNALLSFIAPDTISILGAAGVNSGSWTDPRIAGFHFGFYLRTGAGAIYYSADSANPGTGAVTRLRTAGLPEHLGRRGRGWYGLRLQRHGCSDRVDLRAGSRAGLDAPPGQRPRGSLGASPSPELVNQLGHPSVRRTRRATPKRRGPSSLLSQPPWSRRAVPLKGEQLADMERPRVQVPRAAPKAFSPVCPLAVSPLEAGVDGRNGALRRRINLLFAGCAGAQSRMTVLRG